MSSKKNIILEYPVNQNTHTRRVFQIDRFFCFKLIGNLLEKVDRFNLIVFFCFNLIGKTQNSFFLFCRVESQFTGLQSFYSTVFRPLEFAS